MTRKLGAFASAFFTLGFVAYACTSGEVVTGPVTASGSGGSTSPGTGGQNPAGVAGTTGQAGSNSSRGGTTGTGNTAGTVTSRGGTTGTGNTAGTVTSRGGTTGTGNAAGTIGSGSAGTTGSGSAGTTGSGSAGTSGGCPSTFSVSSNGFVQMPVQGGGCWSGYPYTYADSFGTTVMPAPATAFTTNMLKLTGNLAAVVGTMYSYAGIGFSVAQTASGETPALVTPKGNGLTFNFTNGTTGTGVALRAQVTNGTTTWCTDITTSGPILYSAFKITCYNNPPGAAYNKEPIKGIEMNLAGGTTAGTINVTLTSVTEN